MKSFDNELKSDRISVLEDILLTSESENEKLEAVNQLKKKGDTRAQLAILKALEDRFWRVRENALNSIKPTSIPDETLVKYLVPLINEEFLKIREKAIQLLKEMAKEELLPYFLNKLNDESDLVRSTAIQAIGEIGCEGILESFIKQFHSETSELVKRSLLQAISRIGDETIIDFLIKILGNEHEIVEIRSEAALTLAKSSSSNAFTLISSILNAATLINFKIGLIHSLAFIYNEKTVDYLIELSKNEFQKENFQLSKIKFVNLWDYEFRDLTNSAKIILTVIKTLGILGHKKAIPYLLNKLNSVYGLIRLQSVAALYRFNDSSINERLISIVRDKNEDRPFQEIMLTMMDKINKEKLKSLGLSKSRVTLFVHRKFIDEFFI